MDLLLLPFELLVLNIYPYLYKKVVEILKAKNDLNEQENFLIGFILFKMNNCKEAVHYLNLLNIYTFSKLKV